MLESLNLNSSHHVLDIGCGIGKIAEYISDTTEAKVLGVDFAYGAINAAKERTKEKQERINFVVGNLNNLEAVGQEKYDAIILIDSLYFVSDMPACIRSLKGFLKPKGILAIFYSSTKNSSDTIIDLLPKNKPVGKALTKSGFIFRTYDFSANERKIWEQSIMVANEFKEDFIKEKNFDLYKGRIAEATKNVEAQNKGLVLRSLYIAVLPPS